MDEEKSRLWLLIDIPCVVVMLPFMVIGALCCLAEIGFTFARYHTEKHYPKLTD